MASAGGSLRCIKSTAGGAIASGVDTPLRQMYGTARDYVLGMEFVTGEGVAAKSGGRVVKNVTGYDMHKLMIGALGTLGVITKINFRTFPVPISTRGFVAAFRNAERALELRHRIARSPLTPVGARNSQPAGRALLASEAASQIVPEPLPADVLSTALLDARSPNFPATKKFSIAANATSGRWQANAAAPLSISDGDGSRPFRSPHARIHSRSPSRRRPPRRS